MHCNDNLLPHRNMQSSWLAIWVTLFYFKVLTVKQCVTHVDYCFRFNFTFVLKSLIVIVSYSQLNVWLKIIFVVDSQHTAKVRPVIEHSLWDIRELMTITIDE